MRILREVLLSAAVLLTITANARAEWIAAAYLGSSWTSPATLTLEQPSRGVRSSWSDVHFESRSFESPQYFGYRVAWFGFGRARLGVEGEVTHLKVYAAQGALAPEVQRFSISHGLNLVLANIVWRQNPTSSRRIGLTVRGGAGVAVPHGESQVFGVVQQQYQISSLALQGSAGPVVRLTRHLNAMLEYKLTTANPTVDVADGTMKGRYTSQHLAAGLEVRW